MYYSCTTLTTVGFGDYVPKSDLERLLISFSLLLGVVVFSVIFDEFAAMVDNW